MLIGRGKMQNCLIGDLILITRLTKRDLDYGW